MPKRRRFRYTDLISLTPGGGGDTRITLAEAARRGRVTLTKNKRGKITGFNRVDEILGSGAQRDANPGLKRKSGTIGAQRIARTAQDRALLNRQQEGGRNDIPLSASDTSSVRAGGGALGGRNTAAATAVPAGPTSRSGSQGGRVKISFDRGVRRDSVTAGGVAGQIGAQFGSGNFRFGQVARLQAEQGPTRGIDVPDEKKKRRANRSRVNI